MMIQQTCRRRVVDSGMPARYDYRVDRPPTEEGNMARYLVIRVDSNDGANLLMQKLGPLESVQVIGVFFAGAKFCECTEKPKAKKHSKLLIWYCPQCKRPRKEHMQHPRNLLVDPEIHIKHHDVFISVWEPPHEGDPREKYGHRQVEAIRMTPERKAGIQKRIQRARRNKERKVKRGR